MSYLNESKAKDHLRHFFRLFLKRKISLRNLQKILLVLITCLSLEIFFLGRPAYLQWRSRQREKLSWQAVLQTKPNNKTIKSLVVPSLDQLPDMIDR